MQAAYRGSRTRKELQENNIKVNPSAGMPDPTKYKLDAHKSKAGFNVDKAAQDAQMAAKE